jgi:hypothetical protein
MSLRSSALLAVGYYVLAIGLIVVKRRARRPGFALGGLVRR